MTLDIDRLSARFLFKPGGGLVIILHDPDTELETEITTAEAHAVERGIAAARKVKR